MTIEIRQIFDAQEPTEIELASFVRAICENLQRCPEEFAHIVRPVNTQDEAEVKAIVALVQRNFGEHPHYQISETEGNHPLNQRVIAKYKEANSLKNLCDSMNQPNAFPFLLEQDGEVLGFILCKVANDQTLRVHRLHTSLSAPDRGVLGAGKALLNMAAMTARRLNISTLTSTASYPAKGYFEHLGWRGELEQNEFPFDDGETVTLTQFRCFFEIPIDFEGF